MRILVLLAVCLALAACEQGTTAVAPGPSVAEAAAPPPPDLQPFVGQSYTDLATSPETERYAVGRLAMDANAQARFAKAMSLSAPAWIVEGGGTSAFVVVGCEAGACSEAAGILAIDTQTGEIYAAVRDSAGRAVLIGNDRLQALIEATSPANLWADPDAWADGAPASDAPT